MISVPVKVVDDFSSPQETKGERSSKVAQNDSLSGGAITVNGNPSDTESAPASVAPIVNGSSVGDNDVIMEDGDASTSKLATFPEVSPPVSGVDLTDRLMLGRSGKAELGEEGWERRWALLTVRCVNYFWTHQ